MAPLSLPGYVSRRRRVRAELGQLWAIIGFNWSNFGSKFVELIHLVMVSLCFPYGRYPTVSINLWLSEKFIKFLPNVSFRNYNFISITSWHFLNYSPITCVCDPRGHVYNCFPTDTKVHKIQIPFSYFALCCQKHYLLQNISSRHQQWYRWKISKLWFPGQNGKLSSTRKWRRKLHWREDGWSLIDSIFLLKGKVIELIIFPTHFQYQKETLFSTNKDLFLLKFSSNNIFGWL